MGVVVAMTRIEGVVIRMVEVPGFVAKVLQGIAQRRIVALPGREDLLVLVGLPVPVIVHVTAWALLLFVLVAQLRDLLRVGPCG